MWKYNSVTFLHKDKIFHAFSHIMAVRTISEFSHANGCDMCFCTDGRDVHIIPLHILVCVNLEFIDISKV
jgi:hypothetical protein